ncbi:hypothetical protein GDO81_009481 [Engystomops pustulosus]|uniref:Uncharacterized protein n=1 Tax=Engystomops pustulosus TaxID=76066 RepID=A0AAV7BR96_ENGPU|nr:hypothetical protein GDO81_009481 [Engystomops pustulosus]
MIYLHYIYLIFWVLLKVLPTQSTIELYKSRKADGTLLFPIPLPQKPMAYSIGVCVASLLFPHISIHSDSSIVWMCAIDKTHILKKYY